MVDFTIQEWIELAETDPDAFEFEREKLLQEFIHNSSNQRLLKGLQFRINAERQKSKNPMDSCLRISRMMGDKFYLELCPALEDLKDINTSENRFHKKEPKSAKIIPFISK